MGRFDIAVHEDGFGFAVTDTLGMASGALFRCGQSREDAVLADNMALGTVREARFFGMRPVKEIKRLVLLRIEEARECHPADEQRHRETESEGQGITPAPHSPTLQSVLQKKC